MIFLVKAKNTSYIPKYKDLIYLDLDKKYIIEQLRKPYGQMIASCYFEAEMILWILEDSKRIEKFMEDFNERHKQKIIDLNIQIPKIVEIEKIKIMTCPYCYIEFQSLKDLKNHIEENREKPDHR